MPVLAIPKSFTYHTAVDNVIGRTAVLHSGTKPELRVASPPEFKGEDGVWTPEDLFVASIEVCLMLTFIGIADKRDLRFARYESTAEGVLEWVDGAYRFTRVIVRPRITVEEESDIVNAHIVLERAHATCLVARSVSAAVIVEPEVVIER